MISGTLFNARALAGAAASQPPQPPADRRPTVPVMPSQRPSAPPAPPSASGRPPAASGRAVALRGSTKPSQPPTGTPSSRSIPPPNRRPTSMSPAAHSSLPYAVQAPAHGVTALTQPGASELPPPPSAPPPAARPSNPVPAELRAQREQAEALWLRVEALAKRGDNEVALVTARAALKHGNTPPEREALLGWLIYQHGGAGTRIHPHVWKCLNHALQRDPLCEEALYYKALLLARVGKIDQAHAHFARVLLLNPKHRDAEREVRIIEMRRNHERQQSGFLRRLLTGRPPAKPGDANE
jgi:tetratricopeptide (TPR) repeat protein